MDNRFALALLLIGLSSPVPSFAASSANEVRMRLKPADVLPLLTDSAVDVVCLVEQPAGALPRLDVYMAPDSPDKILPPVRGFVIEQIQHKKKFRFLGVKMGTSTSNDVLGTGTLGCAVADRTCPTITGYVTCNHVATAVVPGCYQGSAKTQVSPGLADSTACCPSTVIGTVIRRVDINPSQADVDAAFVASRATSSENFCGLCATSDVPADPAGLVGHSILKCGRTTGLSCGTVTGASCIVKVPDSGFCDAVWFVDQIRVETAGFAKAGDSGSVAYSQDGKVVGLVFYGDDDAITFLNPMSAVLCELNVSLVLSACGREPPCPPENSVIAGYCPDASPP